MTDDEYIQKLYEGLMQVRNQAGKRKAQYNKIYVDGVFYTYNPITKRYEPDE